MKKKQKLVPSENPKYTEAECNSLAKKYDAEYLIKQYQIYPCQVLMLESMVGEEWKDIDVDGYEGLYMVSNFGRLKSLNNNRTRKSKILKQAFTRDDYLICAIWKKGKQKMMYIHRLVSKAFLDNPDNLETVNHINEVKMDNRVSNLEWLSLYDNQRYGTRDKRSAEANTNNPLRSKKVVQINAKNGEFVKTYLSAHDVERQSNGYFKNYNVCLCANLLYNTKERKLKPYKGYFFVWLKDLNNEEKAV